jgi:hypothetical protein
MQMFNSLSTIEEKNRTKLHIVSWGSWGEYPMNTLWNEMAKEKFALRRTSKHFTRPAELSTSLPLQFKFTNHELVPIR